MKVLIVDNYDSFTFNLFHLVEQCDVDVDVLRNDELDLDVVSSYDRIILSPGPGLPSETVAMFAILERFAKTKPILGVCLGMQGIVEFFGGSLINQTHVKHGVTTTLLMESSSNLFSGIPDRISVGLYHSWATNVSESNNKLIVLAKSTENVVMAIAHQSYPIYGVQFHPESIMTEFGKELIHNFLFNCQ